MLLLILIALIAWSILVFIGIERGLRRRLVVFRGWGDVSLTAALIAAALFWLVSLRQSPDTTHAIPVTPLLLLAVWLLLTKTANPRWLDLGLSIPAKLTLVALTLLTAGFALSSAFAALSRKSDTRTRLANAAIASGAAAATWYLCRTIRQLATKVPSVAAPAKYYGHKPTVL